MALQQKEWNFQNVETGETFTTSAKSLALRIAQKMNPQELQQWKLHSSDTGVSVSVQHWLAEALLGEGQNENEANSSKILTPKKIAFNPPQIIETSQSNIVQFRPPIPKSLLSPQAVPASVENPTFAEAPGELLSAPKSAIKQDRRRFPRFEVDLHAKVCIDGQEYLRKTVNLSEGGVLLDDLLPDGFSSGKQVRIILFELDNGVVELLAKTVDGPNRHRAYEFHLADESTLKKIQEWTKNARLFD